jgi:hypothetical protein
VIIQIGFLKCLAVSGEFGRQCGALNKLYFLDAQTKKDILFGSAAPESRCECIQWHGKCVDVFNSRLPFKFQVSPSAGCVLSHMQNIPHFYLPVNFTAYGSSGPIYSGRGESRPQAA